MRDRFILALRLGVIFSHQPLQLGKFADHFGQQIGLGEAGGSPDLPAVSILLALQIVGLWLAPAEAWLRTIL